MASSSRRACSTSPRTYSALYSLATMANVRRWPIWRGRDCVAVDMRVGMLERRARGATSYRPPDEEGEELKQVAHFLALRFQILRVVRIGGRFNRHDLDDLQSIPLQTH